jgi:hypothetical protein
MKAYDFYKREQNPDWSRLTIKSLLAYAKEHKCSSFIIYASLEARNVIERVEFEVLVIALHDSLDLEWRDLIEEYNGIQKLNNKYKVLKYRYQTFTEAFSSVILDDFSLKFFDFKKAEDFRSKLAGYIHLYTRMPEELLFESEFMQSGVKLIEEFISFLGNVFTIHDKQIVYGTVNFSTLKNGFDIEFKNWLNCVDEDIEALKERLREIANIKSVD